MKTSLYRLFLIVFQLIIYIYKCFIDEKYKILIDIILDLKIFIIVYEHLQSKQEPLNLRKNSFKKTELHSDCFLIVITTT